MKINKYIGIGILLIVIGCISQLLIPENVRYCIFEQNCGILPEGWGFGILLFTTSLFEFCLGMYVCIKGYYIDKKEYIN